MFPGNLIKSFSALLALGGKGSEDVLGGVAPLVVSSLGVVSVFWARFAGSAWVFSSPVTFLGGRFPRWPLPTPVLEISCLELKVNWIGGAWLSTLPHLVAVRACLRSLTLFCSPGVWCLILTS